MMVVVNYLNTFAVLAPVGLLGAVSGMITSFGALCRGRSRRFGKGIGEASWLPAATFWPFRQCFFFFRGQVSANMSDA
jgi:hypothetical protein